MTLKRFHLFEFCDQSWIPDSIRQVGMGFLETVARVTRIYQPTAPLLVDLLGRSSEKKIVVLGAGSGGGILNIVPHLPEDTQVVLTDIFPDNNFNANNTRITYYPTPVDATYLPKDLSGIRVMYTTFHHFSPANARKILENAVQSREPIAIFEATERSLKGIFAAFFVPILILAFVPFVRPFRWSGLFFTYVLPVVPLLGFWDGIVSTLRTYSAKELDELVSDFKTYDWKFQLLKGPRGESVSSFIGIPKGT